MFCVIRNAIIEFGERSSSLEEVIAGVAPDPKTGKDINSYRLTLQYDGGGAKILEKIASNAVDLAEIDRHISSSVENLIETFETIQEFISEKFENIDLLRQFFTTFIHKVKLIRIKTPSLKNALKVFETINERGAGLTSMDLLKNYLFINTSHGTDIQKHWKKLKDDWEKLIKILYDVKEDPMRFLRYYVMSHYEVNLQNNFPQEEIYDWFIEKGSEHDIDKNPFQFVETLILASEHYSNFLQGKSPDGSDNPYLANIKKLQGRYSQHFMLLLAGRFLPKELFVELCYQVENLLFVYTITRSTRKDVNMIRNFSQWSRVLRNVQTPEQFKIFVDSYFKKELASFSNDFDLAFRGLSDSKIARFRLRYILAKLTQFVDEQAYENSKPLSWYLNKTIDIEYILPRSETAADRKSFDKATEYDYYAGRLGNLTLLEKTINRSISDKTYDSKKVAYPESQILLTRALDEKPGVGKNTKLNRAVKSLGLRPFKMWNSESIEKRQEMLLNLARKVWGMENTN